MNRKFPLITIRKLETSCFAAMLAVLLPACAFAEEAFKSGYATAHDGTNIYFEVHGIGDKTLLLLGAVKNEYIKALADAYQKSS